MKKTILVTGGAGYIGSHCCKALAEAGYLPVTYDNLCTGHEDFVQWGPLVVGDLRDRSALREVFQQHNISAVMHFAALSQVGESVAFPERYYDNNVNGTICLLDAMRDAGCRSIVFSSTGAVYGDGGSEPIRETAPLRPVNPYGRTKLVVEGMLDDHRAAHGMQFVCLRYFNASGADQSALVGELRDPETHLIPRALMSLQGYVRDFALFGEDYETPDGTAIRDYIHVSDLARAHIIALGYISGGASSGHFNLGTGSGFSVQEILSTIEKVTGRSVDVVRKPRRAGDPPVLVADPAAARSVLGFKPIMSDLSTIIGSAWTWHKKAHPVRAAQV